MHARENTKDYLRECGVGDKAEENGNQKIDIAFAGKEGPPRHGCQKDQGKTE
jgi:hypothetical protein